MNHFSMPAIIVIAAMALVGILTDAKAEEREKSSFEISIKYEYPKFERANIDSSVKNWLDRRMENIVDSGKDAVGIDVEDAGTATNIDYQIATTASNAISVVFITATYIKGAAHPSAEMTILNYGPDGEVLTFDDLFKDPQKAMEICQESLPDLLEKELLKEYPDAFTEDKGLKEYDMDWFQEGIKATKDNYSCIELNSDGIRVHFQQYQILPYFFGIPSALVPLSKLAPAGPNTTIWPQAK